MVKLIELIVELLKINSAEKQQGLVIQYCLSTNTSLDEMKEVLSILTEKQQNQKDWGAKTKGNKAPKKKKSYSFVGFFTDFNFTKYKSKCQECDCEINSCNVFRQRQDNGHYKNWCALCPPPGSENNPKYIDWKTPKLRIVGEN